MNIDISDEMLEQMVKKQVEERINAWITRGNLEYMVKDFVKQAVTKELDEYKYYEVVQSEARKLIKKEVMDGVCNRISEDIAQAFADKYGDY